MSTPYTRYCTPDPSTTYSSTFFSKLTFRNSVGLTYPAIAPLGSLTNFVFLDDAPNNEHSSTISKDEVIPDLSDLLGIARELETQYAGGKRFVSLVLQLTAGNERRTCTSTYHFSKVCSLIFAGTNCDTQLGFRSGLRLLSITCASPCNMHSSYYSSLRILRLNHSIPIFSINS